GLEFRRVLFRSLHPLLARRLHEGARVGVVALQERPVDVEDHRPHPAHPPSSPTGRRGVGAGPLITSPSGAKREPWQGQSQLRSTSFQCTMHPRWVQTAESSCATPSSSRKTATGFPSRRTTTPRPGSTSCSVGAPPSERRIHSR